MTTSFDWRDVARDGEPQACPKCRAQAFVTAVEFPREKGRTTPIRRDTAARFCIECGYQETA